MDDARPRNDPPLVLKITIVVGLVTLVIGIGSAIYLRLIEGDEQQLGADAALVRLTHVPDDGKLRLTATWSIEKQTKTEEGVLAEPGLWAFHEAPRRESLTLTVWRDNGTAWVQRAVMLDWREPVTVDLPSE